MRNVGKDGVRWPRIEEETKARQEDENPRPGKSHVQHDDGEWKPYEHRQTRDQKVGTGEARPQFVPDVAAQESRTQAGHDDDGAKRGSHERLGFAIAAEN